MGEDYLPNSCSARLKWLSNYRDKIVMHAETLGLKPHEVAEIRQDIDACLAAHDNLSRLRNSLHAAVASVRKLERVLAEKIGAQIAVLKSASSYTGEVGGDLGIIGEASLFDPDAYKPSFRLMVEAGTVRVDFVKGEADAVNIYSRIHGQTAWRFIARDTNSPYMDCSALAGTETTEVREYVLRGVLDDEEIGHASEVMSATCGESIPDVNRPSGKRVGRWV